MPLTASFLKIGYSLGSGKKVGKKVLYDAQYVSEATIKSKNSSALVITCPLKVTVGRSDISYYII